MTERSIIFNGDMVRAILDGRKTQTRRPVEPQPEHSQHHEWGGRVVYEGEHRMWCWKKLVLDNLIDFPGGEDRQALAAQCPFGQPGDLLWVKEPWCPGCGTFPEGRHGTGVPDTDGSEIECGPWSADLMPKASARLWLRVTAVRVERLQDISEADCMREGFTPMSNHDTFDDVRLGFHGLWDDIYAAKGLGWETNPWVWVIEFEVVKQS